MSNPVIPNCGTHHIAIQTTDLQKALELYRDTLGMTVVAEFGSEQTIMLLDTGDGSHIELFAPKPGMPDEANHHPVTHFALTTSDTRGAIEVVREAGYEVTVEPKEVQLAALRVTIAFFKGPSGEVIEFFQTHQD